MERRSTGFKVAVRKHRSDAPSQHVARISWMLLTLLFDGVLDYAACVDHFGISLREFQRDLRKLREICRRFGGFTVSHIRGGRAFLYDAGTRKPRKVSGGPDVNATLARIAAALGGPIERELRRAFGGTRSDMRTGFLHVREALPSDDRRVGETFAFLKEAAAHPARVEFSYTPARGARAMRRAEPYHIVARSGRYYLVAYDLGRRDWRLFALDAIAGPMRKEGLFTPRRVPERFLAERAVGWIAGAGSVEVTVRLSPLVAAAVGARVWQQGQRFARSPDGGGQITFQVEDLGEAVRWALGFGSEAVIVAPPEAVALACRTVEQIAAAYAGTAGAPRESRAQAG